MKRAIDTPSTTRVVCGLLVAFTVAHFVYLVFKLHWTIPPGDFNVGYISSLMVRKGVNLYDHAAVEAAFKTLSIEGITSFKPWSNHPPPYYVIKIPLTFLSIHAAGLLWRLFSLFVLGLTGYLLMKTLFDGWSWEWIALTCLVFLSGRVFVVILQNGNNMILFLCLLTAVWWAHKRDRPWLAGALLGVSVIFKPMPLMLIPLFLIKRRYKTVLATLATLLGLIIFSMLLIGSSVIIQWLSRIKVFHDYVLHRSFQLSSISLVHKLLGGTHPSLAYGLGAGAMVALYAVSLYICARRGGPLSVGEYALMVTLIPISSPYVYLHHLALLVFPLLVVAHILLDVERFPGLRWGVFTVTWLAWALGFYYFRWGNEIRFGPLSLLGYVPLFSAISLWGLLLSCIGTRPAESIMDKPSPSEITLRS